MSTRPSGPARPDAVPQLMPDLVCAGAARAIDFYVKALGATEMMRLAATDGRLMHACLGINGALVFLADEFPEQSRLSPKSLGGTPVTLHLMVEDADAAAARAVAAGATVVMPVEDMFWGDRYGVVEDPFGHRWAFATPKRRVTEEELREGAKAAMSARQ